MDQSHDTGGLLEGYLTPRRLAAQLGISLRTLGRWHAERAGPPRTTMGRLILYRADAVREWLEEHEGHAPRPRSRLREVRS